MAKRSASIQPRTSFPKSLGNRGFRVRVPEGIFDIEGRYRVYNISNLGPYPVTTVVLLSPFRFYSKASPPDVKFYFQSQKVRVLCAAG